jgi:hypothetical protein
MPIPIPPSERVPGVSYALTPHGTELPVIDVTHPSFALDQSEAAIRSMRDHATSEMARWQRRPRWLRRIMVALLARKSVLLRGLRSAKGTFLTAMNTYLLKLPPAHLASSFARPADRRFASAAPLVDVRLRLQVTAGLIAESIASSAAASASTSPVFLYNIGGGPAMDSLNAIILARQRSAETVSGRPIHVVVLDPHDEAPGFGRNALESLRSPGGRLAGLDVTFVHEPYDWDRPETLRALLARQPGNAIAVGSSEGGLFHYGSDEAIRANLRVLHDCTAPHFALVGSLSPDTPATRDQLAIGGAAVRLFRADAFAALVRDTGWRVDQEVEIFRTLCFRLVKA